MYYIVYDKMSIQKLFFLPYYRVMAVLDPLKVVITNLNEDQVLTLYTSSCPYAVAVFVFKVSLVWSTCMGLMCSDIVVLVVESLYCVLFCSLLKSKFLTFHTFQVKVSIASLSDLATFTLIEVTSKRYKQIFISLPFNFTCVAVNFLSMLNFSTTGDGGWLSSSCTWSASGAAT